MAVTSDEGATASMCWWRKRGHCGGRGVARIDCTRAEVDVVEVGLERICFVRISGFVIRLI